MTKYCTDSSYGTVDNKTTLEPEDDAATQIMGSDWRMPTNDEFQELLDNTTNEWITNYNGTGVNGEKFTSKTDTSKYIFIPATGFYSHGSVNAAGVLFVWSSSLGTPNSCGRYLNFFRDSLSMGRNNREYGHSVRGVRK